MRWITLLTVLLLAGPAGGATEVTIPQGALKGVVEDAVTVFRGIPYAADTGGANRWRPPQPAPQWEGVRDASAFGTACPQDLRPGYNKAALERVGMGEDCLNLNVYTSDTTAKMPVMVWVLPGSFRVGDASMSTYRGHALARQGVVVVTFNYRLGVLGRFGHPALTREQAGQPKGTYLLMDQVAALEWVRDHIAAFGGDPGNVTLFGMSAGGVSVNYQMTLPQSKGLFHRAISQSGSIRPTNPKHLVKDQPFVPSLHSEGEKLAAHFGIEGDDAATAQALRDLPWKELVAWQESNLIGSLNPALDDVFLTEAVGTVFREGRQHPVPFVAGATSYEGSLISFLPTWDPLLAAFQVDRAEAESLYAGMDDRQRVNALETDFFYGSQRYLVKHHAKSDHPAFLYYFNRLLDEEVGKLPGAPHGAETPYVFQSHVSEDGGVNRSSIAENVSVADIDYATMVSAIWINIARTGDPNGEGLPAWPAFSFERDAALHFNQGNTKAEVDFRASRMDYWERQFDDGKL